MKCQDREAGSQQAPKDAERIPWALFIKANCAARFVPSCHFFCLQFALGNESQRIIVSAMAQAPAHAQTQPRGWQGAAEQRNGRIQPPGIFVPIKLCNYILKACRHVNEIFTSYTIMAPKERLRSGPSLLFPHGYTEAVD